MKPVSSKAFFAVLAFELLFLGGMVFHRMNLLATGRPVLLQCRPIDPRSLFSGDYVVLRYEISSLREDEEGRKLNIFDEEVEEGDRLFVALEKSGAFHRAAAYSKSIDKLRKAGYNTIIAGEVVRRGRNFLSLRYGVEDFFVPQYEGRKIERDLSKVSVEVVVSPGGESAIRRLFIDGDEVVFH